MARWRSRHFTAVTTLGFQEVELEHSKVVVSWLLLFHMLFSEDKFDHDKAQKSAISGRRLHWRLSSLYVQFSKTSPLKSGESSEKSSGENRVKSCHVCGCHGFFGPDLGFPQLSSQRASSAVDPRGLV